MHEFPHHYHVDAGAETEGNVLASAENLPTINCAALTAKTHLEANVVVGD